MLSLKASRRAPLHEGCHTWKGKWTKWGRLWMRWGRIWEGRIPWRIWFIEQTLLLRLLSMVTHCLQSSRCLPWILTMGRVILSIILLLLRLPCTFKGFQMRLCVEPSLPPLKGQRKCGSARYLRTQWVLSKSWVSYLSIISSEDKGTNVLVQPINYWTRGEWKFTVFHYSSQQRSLNSGWDGR